LPSGGNGQEAFVQAMSDQPDIVLMDINLEESREGIEVAKKLRDSCEARIVFVTGYTDPDTVKRIRKEVPGAPLLPKPVGGDRLADAVKAVMTFSMW
jgi:DNA-binding NarL/FixJ family response regulator